MDGVVFVRPLLSFSKPAVLNFLKENRIAYCRDASNDSVRFVRNRIRKKILPVLERELNPRVIEALSRIPAILSAENETLDFFEEKAWRRVLGKKQKRKIVFRRRDFLSLPEALQFRILGRAVKRMDTASGLNFEAWQKIRGVLARGRGRHSLPKDIDFSLTSKKASLYKKFPLRAPK